MRLKVLSLFLAVQFASFALWQGVHAWEQKKGPEPIVVTSESALSTPIPSGSHEAAKPKLNQINFSSVGANGKRELPLESDRRDELMAVINKLPSEHVSTLRKLVLDDNQVGRGLGGRNRIYLRGVDMDIAETDAVLIHEIGHIVDLGYLAEKNQSVPSEFRDVKVPIYQGDPSLDFYRISWDNESVRKKNATNLDFVSGYASFDPFEDFAESYAYYILHNQNFKYRTQTSNSLLKKYEYLRDVVFKGKIFATGEYKPEDKPLCSFGNSFDCLFDATLLSDDLDGFLNG